MFAIHIFMNSTPKTEIILNKYLNQEQTNQNMYITKLSSKLIYLMCYIYIYSRYKSSSSHKLRTYIYYITLRKIVNYFQKCGIPVNKSY